LCCSIVKRKFSYMLQRRFIFPLGQLYFGFVSYGLHGKNGKTERGVHGHDGIGTRLVDERGVEVVKQGGVGVGVGGDDGLVLMPFRGGDGQ